ncbi:MAG: DUF6265 family protein [Gemmatimonadaceae bacterium]
MPTIEVALRTTTVCGLAVMAVAVIATHAPADSANRARERTAMSLPAPEMPTWLAGCWEHQAGAITIEEFWMSPRGGVMLGMGRTTKSDAVVEFEHTRIYVRGDSLVYHAQPSGQTATEFVAPAGFSDALTFSNPTHDFPQRVIYRRGGQDSLFARVEGTSKGRSRGIDFAYQRARCPGS